MIIKLTNVRICFCNSLFTPAQVMGQGDLKYGATFLVPKNDPQIKKIQESMSNAASEKWDIKGKAILAGLITNSKIFLRDGDTKPEIDGYEGNMFFNAVRLARDGQPVIINMDKTEITEADGIIYAGCYVDVSFEVYAQDNAHGKRINSALRAVRFRKAGDALAGSIRASDNEFDDVLDIGQGQGQDNGIVDSNDLF